MLIAQYQCDVLWDHQGGFLTHPEMDGGLFPELS